MDADWPRPVVHFEIGAADPELIRAFYAQLFNWDIGDGPIMTIPAGVGGPEPGPAAHIRQSEHPGVSLYIQVRHLRESLAKATELGGNLLVEPFDIPGGATVALIRDPEGSAVGLVQQ
ncbi:MAG: VOC family protein [Acidimicrobiales bacterium]